MILFIFFLGVIFSALLVILRFCGVPIQWFGVFVPVAVTAMIGILTLGIKFVLYYTVPRYRAYCDREIAIKKFKRRH